MNITSWLKYTIPSGERDTVEHPFARDHFGNCAAEIEHSDQASFVLILLVRMNNGIYRTWSGSLPSQPLLCSIVADGANREMECYSFGRTAYHDKVSLAASFVSISCDVQSPSHHRAGLLMVVKKNKWLLVGKISVMLPSR